jgi:hypothetical protein
LSSSHLYYADSSGGDLYLTLPNASHVEGYLYQIKKTSSSNSVFISGNGLIDSQEILELANNSLGSTKLLAAGGNWHIISQQGESSTKDIASSNLVLHWKLDEVSGLTAIDGKGSYNGTLVNMVGSEWTNTGVIDGALLFDGSADHITHSLTSPKPEGTWSHWVRADQIRRMVTFYESDGTGVDYNGFGGSSSVLEIHLGINSGGKMELLYQDGAPGSAKATCASVTSISVGTWYHVGVTWDTGNEIKLYLNGVLEGTTSTTGLVFDGRTATVKQLGRVGDGAADRHWDGMIDDVRVYNRVINSNEMFQLYLRSRP